MIIDTLRAEFETWQQTLPESAVSRFTELPCPPGAGRAAQVAVNTPSWLVEATVWESGETDLYIGNLAGGGIEADHMELSTGLGVRNLLDHIAQAVR